ncbi:MAG: phosphocholine cytidylyltransferase family protein [Deltaproteobacteria bacterium]|nr:phosphocholine cytidylyltransferase family protein [Candidatus Tharpellaceae bacterium]
MSPTFQKLKKGDQRVKAIILSAGQGKRLLPLTSEMPKCLLPIGDKTLLERQLDALAICGVEQITVVVGYGADKVESLLKHYSGPQNVETFLNAEYATSDNLVSCWKVREKMAGDFLLINGDTLFEAAIPERLLQMPKNEVTVTISHKKEYDADDMKVQLDGTRLLQIGKTLAAEEVDAESIGMILFREPGAAWFRAAMEQALKEPAARKRWYLSVINEMARSKPVWTCAVAGLSWAEVDYPADLEHARQVFK